jgi:hypothetical protein
VNLWTISPEGFNLNEKKKSFQKSLKDIQSIGMHEDRRLDTASKRAREATVAAIDISSLLNESLRKNTASQCRPSLAKDRFTTLTHSMNHGQGVLDVLHPIPRG